MSFNQRTSVSEKLIDYLYNNYWNKEIISSKHKILHIPYGYENYFSSDIQKKMKHRYTDTTKFIRFSPDYFIM